MTRKPPKKHFYLEAIEEMAYCIKFLEEKVLPKMQLKTRRKGQRRISATKKRLDLMFAAIGGKPKSFD